MAKRRGPAIADIDEDPNIEIRPYSSPPCYAHEVDPAYFGLAPAPQPVSRSALDAALRHVRTAAATLRCCITRSTPTRGRTGSAE